MLLIRCLSWHQQPTETHLTPLDPPFGVSACHLDLAALYRIAGDDPKRLGLPKDKISVQRAGLAAAQLISLSHTDRLFPSARLRHNEAMRGVADLPIHDSRILRAAHLVLRTKGQVAIGCR